MVAALQLKQSPLIADRKWPSLQRLKYEREEVKIRKIDTMMGSTFVTKNMIEVWRLPHVSTNSPAQDALIHLSTQTITIVVASSVGVGKG